MRDTLLEVEIDRFESFRRHRCVEVVKWLRVSGDYRRVITETYCYDTDTLWKPTCRAATKADMRAAAEKLNQFVRMRP